MKRIYSLKLEFMLLFFFLIAGLFTAYAQFDGKESSNGLSWNFDEDKSEDFSIGTFISEIFTPQLVVDTKNIRQYIIDERFQALRNKYGDMRTIDAIFLKSLRIAEYNIARALFLSLMAVLEHRKFDLKMPIVSSLKIPLTFEKDSIFSIRLKHLPTHIYKDSPVTLQGDRDKLQHFFGSAYLSYVSEAPEFARTIGNLIEWGEAALVVDGTDDPRDMLANKQGECFGRDLLVVMTLLPSDYLTFQHEDSK